jgi:pimeloyl-ACP methyl ester carboxylesterase
VATFVLVHGAWGGGWQWRGVARVLRAVGHEVTTPTLSGQGERAHVNCEPITLLTHIDDLSEHLWFEDLTEVVLVGWSYGVGPVEGVADRMPERLRTVVNLDGSLVREGDPFGLDGWPADQAEEFVTTGWIPAPRSEDLADVLADAALREFVAARLKRLPTAALTTPFPDRDGRRWQVPHVHLACTTPAVGDQYSEEELAADLAEKAAIKRDSRWNYRELDVTHLGLLYDPEVVAGALLDVL